MLSARALTSSSAAWRGCGRRLLPGCMAELLHGWRAALPWGRAALMRCGRTLTCVFEHFAQSRLSRPLPCRMAAVAAPFACHADATAPALHFPPPPADAAANFWRAGPSARERPISARNFGAFHLAGICQPLLPPVLAPPGPAHRARPTFQLQRRRRPPRCGLVGNKSPLVAFR